MEMKDKNHFQKKFLSKFFSLLEERSLAQEENRLRNVNRYMENHSYSYHDYKSAFNSAADMSAGMEEQAELEGGTALLRVCLEQAAKLAQEEIEQAPVRVYNDYGELGTAMAAFFSDIEQRDIRMDVDLGHTIGAYYFHKLQYSDTLDLLYGTACTNLHYPMKQIQDMKYQGFVSRTDGTLYALKENAQTAWIHRPSGQEYPEDEGNLQARLKLRIKQEVENMVAASVTEEEIEQVSVDIARELNAAAKSFAGDTELNSFQDQVVIWDSFWNDSRLVQFVDNPDATVKEMAQNFLRGAEDKYRRLYIGCRASQLVLEKLRNMQGKTNKAI